MNVPRRTLMYIAVASLLTACAGTAPTPEPRIVTQEVKVPVATACLKRGDVPVRPDFPDRSMTVETPLDEAFRLMAAGILSRDAFIARQRGVIEGCVEN